MLPELVVPTLVAYFNHNGKIFGMIDHLLYILYKGQIGLVYIELSRVFNCD